MDIINSKHGTTTGLLIFPLWGFVFSKSSTLNTYFDNSEIDIFIIKNCFKRQELIMVNWVIVLALHSTSSHNNQSEMCVHNLTHSNQQKTNSTRLTNVWKEFSQTNFTSHAPDPIV